MEWIFATLSLTGVILNVYKNKWGFVFWLFANIGWVYINLKHEIYSQAILFAIYFILAAVGLYQWSKESKNGKNK
jgi:nicotinamide riboside transporter PnuC